MITKALLKDFRIDMENAIDEVSKKYGIEAKKGFHIGYTPTSFQITKVEFFEKSNDDKSIEQKEFEKVCDLFNMKESDYNSAYMIGGRKMFLIGFKPNAPKFPYLVRDEEGKIFKVRELKIKA